MRYNTILLDLDGTLMNSGEGIMRSAQYALSNMGITVDDWHSLRFFVGPPLEDSFKDFYGLDDAAASRAVESYRKRYFSVGVLEQEPYEGVNTFLKNLKDMGLTLCLATSKMMKQSHFVVDHFGLNKYIDHVFARDDAGILHTKADVINSAIESLGHPERHSLLMVGDRKFDIIGAKECRIDSIGVLYGYGDRQELEEAGATYICKDFHDIINIIKQS